jgi:hypothetical protein
MKPTVDRQWKWKWKWKCDHNNGTVHSDNESDKNRTKQTSDVPQ